MKLDEIVSYVFIALGLVSLISGYIAKYDKKHAQFWNDLHNGADTIVAQFDVLRISNQEKKADATQALMKQMEESGHKHVTETVAQGAIEQAVTRRTPVTDNKINVDIDTKPILDKINELKPVFKDMKAGE